MTRMAPGSSEIAIIPALNEAQRVGAVIADLRRAMPDLDVVVVNDGSSDDTEGVARRAGALVVSHPYRLGYGAALSLILAGFILIFTVTQMILTRRSHS